MCERKPCCLCRGYKGLCHPASAGSRREVVVTNHNSIHICIRGCSSLLGLNYSSCVSSLALSNRAAIACGAGAGAGAALCCRLLPQSPLPAKDNNLKDNLKDSAFCLSTFTPLPINPLPTSFSSFLFKALA